MNMPTTVRLATKTDIKQSLSSRCTADFEPAYDRCGSFTSIFGMSATRLLTLRKPINRFGGMQESARALILKPFLPEVF